MNEVKIKQVEANGLSLTYREAGSGKPVLLLHGWPTSSFLWRNIMPHIAEHRRVIAIDLPGFGASDKPLDRAYTFDFFRQTLDDFLDALDIDETGLAIHDIGGPIGLYWASQSGGRVEKLSVLNTIAYPELSVWIKAFVASCSIPGVRSMLTSQWGLKKALHIGVADKSRLRDDAVDGIRKPFETKKARKALLKAGSEMNVAKFHTIADWLPTIDFPVQAIYGAKDKILPDIASTIRRLKADIPQIDVTCFDDCGHFLQEERPEEVGALMDEFFG